MQPLIINPYAVEVARGACDTAPPRSSWTDAFGGRGVGTTVALGYDWGRIRLEGEYLHRNTVYGDQAGMDILRATRTACNRSPIRPRRPRSQVTMIAFPDDESFLPLIMPDADEASCIPAGP